MNPTSDAFEKRFAALEGGAVALAVASGQAVSDLSVQNRAKAGNNIVKSNSLYDGAWNLFAHTLRERLGSSIRPIRRPLFAPVTNVRATGTPTLPNPKRQLFPIAEVAALGRSLGIPLTADNTAAPLLVRAFDHGVAAITYFATKNLSRHGTTIAGLIVDGSNFDFALNTPDPSYDRAVWSQAAKPLGPIAVPRLSAGSKGRIPTVGGVEMTFECKRSHAKPPSMISSTDSPIAHCTVRTVCGRSVTSIGPTDRRSVGQSSIGFTIRAIAREWRNVSARRSPHLFPQPRRIISM